VAAASATVFGVSGSGKAEGHNGRRGNQGEHAGCAESVHRSISIKRGFRVTGHSTRSLSHTGDRAGVTPGGRDSRLAAVFLAFFQFRAKDTPPNGIFLATFTDRRPIESNKSR